MALPLISGSGRDILNLGRLSGTPEFARIFLVLPSSAKISGVLSGC
jgi:hypothetical protein